MAAREKKMHNANEKTRARRREKNFKSEAEKA
jgi:hypothetical protein